MANSTTQIFTTSKIIEETKVPLDYHIHSRFSVDGDDTPEVMCRQAVTLGIPEIGFSEHWDVGPYELNPRFFEPESWFEELQRLRKLFAGQLIIRAGIEIAEPHLYPTQASEVLGRAEYDYVIGSVHNVGSHSMFDPEYFKSSTADEVYGGYFEELERMVSCADIDIVAHFDIPVRFGLPIFGYEPDRYEEQIKSVLKLCVERSLALDVNVSGLRKADRHFMPDPLILTWYREMDGERLTLGSDAHRVADLGLHLDQGLQLLKKLGFDKAAHFEQRQAQILPLE